MEAIKFFIFISFIISGSSLYAQSPDVILYNGKIFTADKKSLYVEAIAIRGEKITAVGKKENILKSKGHHTELIDLQGKTVVPGFNDAHNHAGPQYPCRSFSFTKSPIDPTPWEIIRDSIVNIVSSTPAGTLIRSTINPELLADQRARRIELDSIAPLHPVILSSWTGHGAICNSKALVLLGYNGQTSFLGGRLEKDHTGKLSGLLEEYACFKTSRILADKLPQEKITADLNAFSSNELAFGITSDQVMTTQMSPSLVVKTFTHDFGVRHRLIAFPMTNDKEFLASEWSNQFGELNHKNYVSGVKMILDGTPLERLTCLRSPYSDRPDEYGRLDFNKSTLRKYILFCLQHNQQIIIHATGDSSFVTIVRTLRLIHPDSFWKSMRVRIEHGDMIISNAVDFNTIKKLGIVIVQNPTHLDLPQILTERFDERSIYEDALRSYQENNIVLAIGSDGPMNPFLNIMFAVTNPCNPKEALSVEQAVIAYTYGSAYAEFKENVKGTLMPGKFADLTVLSQDVFTIPVNALPGTRSELTMVGGKILYKAH
jgi:predicted amidohydrolase YtcJ